MDYAAIGSADRAVDYLCRPKEPLRSKAISFRNAASIAALVFTALSLTLVAFTGVIYTLFSLPGNDLGDLLSKRAGALFLGLSILCFLSRGTSSSETKILVSASVGSSMFVMALLGIYELARGNVGLGILIAIAVELAIATIFARIWVQTTSEKDGND